MFGPVRLVTSLRTGAPLPILVGAVAVALMFTATPFLIPEVADRYGVAVGTAGFVSVSQVGAFGITAFAAPKLLAASPRLFTGAAVALVAANALSAATGDFGVLLTVRLVAGCAAGIITWVVWADAMRHDTSMATVAATGPVAALVGSPIFGALSALGDRVMYLVLAAVAVPMLVAPLRRPVTAAPRTKVSRSRSNRVLLAALALLTLSGASLFVYENVYAITALGLSPAVASYAFSLNALGGLIGARLANRHRRPGVFLATAGVAAAGTVVLDSPIAFFAGMAWWGFAFWMGLPGVLQMLSARSLDAAERAGDAQALMALGRAAGPGLGSSFASSGDFESLAYAAGIGLVVTGLTVVAVEEGREHLPATPLEP